jgi:acyl-CoA thioesterase-1
MLLGLLRRWPRLRRALPAAALAALAPACPAGQGPLVVFLGDSLTAGWRLREDEAYPALVARALVTRGRSLRVVNAGVSGDTAAEGHARLAGVLRLRPDVVVVALGINDALRGMPLEATEAALRRIVSEARAGGARVLLVGTGVPRAASPELSDRLRAMYARVASDEKLPFVPDLMRGVLDERGLLFPDGLHPNAAGQARLAENVRPALELLLAERVAGK